MVWEGLDGLWAWGSVTQASKFLKNIHSKSVVTNCRTLMKASGSEGKVWTVMCSLSEVVPSCHCWATRLGWRDWTGAQSLLYRLDLKTNKCPSAALAPQIQTHLIWIPIHSGWVSLADFAVCSHQLSKNNLPCRIKPRWLFTVRGL